MIPILIPPIPHLDLIQGKSYHLVLAHIADNEADATYREFYKAERHRGAYLILDNGAHENTEGMGVMDTLALAKYLGAQEIVLPDVLFNAGATIRRTEEALRSLAFNPVDVEEARIQSIMFVPQGNTVRAFHQCLVNQVRVVQEYKEDYKNLRDLQWVIGVSKDYENWVGGLYALVQYTILPFAQLLNAQVHLLGWGRHLQFLEDIARDMGDQIRSVDSAKPFVYGRYGLQLDQNFLWKASPYPGRPQDYFHKPLIEDHLEIARANCEVFEATARSEA